VNRPFFRELMLGHRAIGVPMLAYRHTATSEPLIAEPQETSTMSNPLKSALNYASIAFALLPLVTGFVQQAEALLVNATGSEKLKAVAASVDAYLAKINADAQTIEAVKNQLEPMVSAMVAMANVAGLFKRKTQDVAPTPAVAK
jgi:hypothetical protein